MYICICNALTDKKLKAAIVDGQKRNAADVYEACGCRVKCGQCARMIKALIREHAPATELALPAP